MTCTRCRVALAWSALWLLAAACGPRKPPTPPFAVPEDPAVTHELAAAALASRGSASPTRLAVAVSHPPDALIAYDVEAGRVRWRRDLDAQGRPEAAGDLVVVESEGAVLGLDSHSGAPRWRRPLAGLRLVGGARADDLYCYAASSMHVGREPARGRITCLDARSGAERWSAALWGRAGRPLIIAAYVVVPWDHHSLLVLDRRTGQMRSRMPRKDGRIEWLQLGAAGLCYGDAGARCLAPAQEGTERSVWQVPLPALPGLTQLFDDAFAARPAARSAYGRIGLRLHLERSETGALRPAQGAVYVTFHRYVFGYALKDERLQLRWVVGLDHDLVQAEADEAGLIVLSEDGVLIRLDPDDGHETRLADLGQDVASASLPAGAPAPTAEPAPRPGGTRAARSERAPAADRSEEGTAALRRALLALAFDPDARLVPARAHAIEALADLPIPEVSRDLLDLYAEPNLPPLLRQRITSALEQRTRGAEHLVQALSQRYDYLEDTRGPPLEVLLPAIVRQERQDALPGLARALFDPDTPSTLRPRVAEALVALGGADGAAALSSFLALYHADSSLAVNPELALRAAEGVLRHGDTEARQRLAALASDPDTPDVIRAGWLALLEPEPPATPAAIATAHPVRGEPRPRVLDQPSIDATFAMHADTLQRCVLRALHEQPNLARVRLAFVVERDGTPSTWALAPREPHLARCLDPLLERIRFPRFEARRQVATYVLAVHRPSTVQDAEQPDASDATDRPWWVTYVRDVPMPPGADADPWWDAAPSSASATSPSGPDPFWWLPPGERPAGPRAADDASTPEEVRGASAPEPATEDAVSEDTQEVDEPAASEKGAETEAPPAASDPAPSRPWWQDVQ